MTVRISLCMIVKNEAASIATCLESARPWVDEIVVVDTGSTDATRDIAARFGAHVVDWRWRHDFAAARNESLRHATGDWILVLDADEALSEGSGQALREACANAGRGVAAYLVKIVCPRDGDGGLVRLNWFPRLFRNLPGVRFEGVIHEQVVGSLAGHGSITPSPVEVLHQGYTLSPAEMRAKAERNLALLERQLREDPTYSPGWFQLAETLVLVGRLDDAIDAYRRCLRLLESSRLTLPPGVVGVALQNLGAALLAKGKRDEGVRTLESAIRVAPDLPPAHVHLGTLAMSEQRWADAEHHFANALAAVDRGGDAGEYQASPWLIHFLGGCSQARQEKLQAAIASFEAALRLNAKHPESLWLLALTSSNARDWERSLQALDRLRELGRDDFPLHAQRAIALAALRRPEAATEAAHRALERDPNSAPMLAVAADSLSRLGRSADAIPLYERLVAIAPRQVSPLLALAQCHEMTGDGNAMMETYQRAVALAPDSPDVLFALGSACIRSGALDAAESCLAAAIEHAPDRADYRLNHALCLLKRGDVAEARDAFSDIVARWPGLPQARELQAIAARLVDTAVGGPPIPTRLDR